MSEKEPLRPSQSHSETFSGESSDTDSLVVEGIARAIRESRIEQDFGEELIKTYLANRIRKNPSTGASSP